MKNKKIICGVYERIYKKVINQEIESSTGKTKYIIKFLFIIVLLMQTVAYQKVFAQSTSMQKNPFAWEIKPDDVDFEFLQKWSYNLNSPNIQKEVRVIYLAPSDKAIRNDYKTAINDAILSLQDFYKREMGNNVTFSLHSPIVESYQTAHNAAWYATNPSNSTTMQAYWFYQNVLTDGSSLTGGNVGDPNIRWIYYIDADPMCGQVIGGADGFAVLSANDFRGLVGEQNIPRCANELPDNGGRNRWIGGLGHELGHSFRLPHPPGCGGAGSDYGCAGGAFAANSIMWVGYASYPNTYFLPEDKQILSSSGFFSQALNCTFSLAPTSGNFTSSGGGGSTTVNTMDGCAWTTSSNDSWITVTAGTTSSGTGSVSFSVAANTGSARTGTITAAGQTFTVNQSAGSNCSFSIGQGTSGSELTAFQGAYTTGGGESILGCATASVRLDGFTSFAGTISHYQTTNNGSIEYHTNGSQTGQAFSILTPFYNKRSLFGLNSNNPLGYPTGVVSQSANSCQGTQYRFQNFEGGLLVQHLSGSKINELFEVHGAIYSKLAQSVFGGCPLGLPIGDESDAPPSGASGSISSGKLNNFEGGQIYFRYGDSAAREVHGLIKNLYVSLGGSASWLGFPLSDEYISNGKARSDFEAGYITTLDGVNYRAFPYLTQAHKLFDFDGDGKADISVFRPANGTWYLLNSQNGFSSAQFGISTDKVVPADYDGDGKTDIAIYRGGTWYLMRSQLGFTGYAFGDSNDIPQPADFDGDGKSEIAVYRPSNGTWYVLNLATNQFSAYQFGASTDKPVVGDYDGDNKADYAVYRQSNGTWYIQRSAAGFTGIQFGDSNDKPIPADYDGDGKTDVAVFRPSNGAWYLNRSQLGFTGVQFGISTDLPTPADYDGDGKADVAVFRNGTWYLQRSTAGFTGVQFGASTDKPVPNAFVP